MKRLFVVAAIICFSALTFSSATAQSPVGLRAVGIEAGWVSPEDIDATWGLSAFFDIGMPMTNLYIEPFIDYWSKTQELTNNMEFTYTDWAIGGKLKYVIPTAMPTWQPFIGAGVAAHMLKAQLDVADPLFSDLSETKIGYHVGGGMSFGVHDQIDLMTEAWYSAVENFNQTTVKAGFAIRL